MPRSTKQRRASPAEAPYLRIAAELRGRIRAGELAPGAAIPSIRRVAAEWGVALATATKAFSTLRHEGLIVAKPRVGSVVAGADSAPANARPRREPDLGAELTRQRIVQVAIASADAEGLSALSMRGVAAKLDVPTMSLYRHVQHKQDLVLLMTDAAFGEVTLPVKPPVTWRARLELSARMQWRLYRRHAWLAHAMTLTRPLALPNVIAHADWMLQALDGLGLDSVTMLHVHMIVYSYVRGIAVNLEAETLAAAESGISEQEWADTTANALNALAASGKIPTFARVLRDLAAGYDLDLDLIFEFGLTPLLDGIASLIKRNARARV